MAGTVTPIPLIPPPTVPLVDPKTGLMNTDWYRFFQQFDAKVRKDIEPRIAALEP